jgi:hypothetical protein
MPVVNLVSNRALFDHALWPHPSLGHGTVDNVPLDPSAMRTGKEAPILTQPGRLNRRKLHWRTAGGALRTLVLCVEHGVPSVWRSEFSGKPTSRVRFEGIRCNDAYLDVIALGAFEQPVFEADGARRNLFQHHPRLATGTARALNGGQELLVRRHGAFPCTEAGALPNSLSPMVAYGGR